MDRRRFVRWAAGALLALMAAVAVVRVTQFADVVGTPDSVASEVEYSGRDYRRSPALVPAVPAGEVPLGRTQDGDVIYGPSPTGTVPTVLHVVVEGEVVQYGLIGGP